MVADKKEDFFAERVVLPTGLVVLLKEVEALPSIHINLTIESGSLFDPHGMEGLSTLTTESLLTGTKSRKAAQISEDMDFTGGSLSVNGGRDYVCLTLNTLKKALPVALEIMSDVLINPTFDENEVGRKKNEIKARIRREEEDPGTVAQKAFLAELFEGQSYGRALLGSEQSISSVSRVDLSNFYSESLSHSRVICAVVGQITLEEFVPMMEKYFKAWPASINERQLQLPSPAEHKGNIKKVERDLKQANIVLGHEGIPRNHPEYHHLIVMNYALGGGGFRSRLMDNIREEKGLAYSIHSVFASRKYAGYFQTVLETKNASAATAITEIIRELDEMKKHGISKEELEEAKLYLTGSFPLKIDTNAKIAGLLTDMEFFNLGLDYPFRYPQLINSVTQDNVNQAAEKYLHPENCTFAIVGRQREINWP